MPPSAFMVGRGRTVAPDRMTDTCSIGHNKGTRPDTLDPTTLTLIIPPGDLVTVYAGICNVKRIKRTRFQGTEDLVGEDWRNVPHGARIPLTAPVPSEGDLFTVLTVGPLSDPGLVGRKFQIVEVGFTSTAIQRYLLLLASQDVSDRPKFR